MEHLSEKRSANKTTLLVEDRDKDGKNCSELESLRSETSLPLCASNNSEQPGSSMLTSLNTVSRNNLNNPWLSIRKSTLRNYGYSNAYVEAEGTDSRLRYNNNKGSLEASTSFHSGSMATYPVGSLSNTGSSISHRDVGNNRSRFCYSSSFGTFFLGQALAKHVPSTNPEPLATSSDQTRDKQAHSDEVASNALMNREALRCHLCSDNIVNEVPKSSHCGTTLREWLLSEGSNISKHGKLHLFKQIVQTVDNAHRQGVAMLELRPSSFVLSETGNIRYIGSLQEIELSNSSKCNKRQRIFEPQIVELRNSCRSENSHLEEKWYACPEESNVTDLLSFNIYSLGLLLFEFLCRFESTEAHSAAMLDLHHRIFPPHFLSECPKEAGFCFWLLHPDRSSCPTTREILQSELLDGYEIDDKEWNADTAIDAELDLLLHFLVSLKERMQNRVLELSKSMEFLNEDIKEVERRYGFKKSRDTQHDSNLEECTSALREKLLGNISQLENAYFHVKSPIQLNEAPDVDRSDQDILSSRDNWSSVQARHNPKEKPVDRVETLFDGICKFAQYTKFEVCGALRNGDILNANSVICSLSFDREEEYVAVAGVSKKIKIFELHSLLNDYDDVQYPVLEMSNKSKFSCICWNSYIKNYLASSDYDGLVQIWDTSTGHAFAKHEEHQRRAWSVDFSVVDPTKFASGGDDCSVRIWNINERNSIGTIWNPANICCVQFSAFSSHLLAFGSADYRIYCYDLRHTRIPWCTLAGHGKAVSYVRHLDSRTLVSASTDNTLKLWDLKKTCLEGLSLNACCLTFTGHTNEKNFTGLAVSDGYIVCGSETNEVYAYYKSLPIPIASHKFECVDPISRHKVSDSNGQFISSVCWRKKSGMIAAANSSGSIKILRLA